MVRSKQSRWLSEHYMSLHNDDDDNNDNNSNNGEGGECEVLSSEGGNNNDERQCRGDVGQSSTTESSSGVAQRQRQQQCGMTTTENNNDDDELRIFQKIMSSTDHRRQRQQQQQPRSDAVSKTLPRTTLLRPTPRRSRRSSTDDDDGMADDDMPPLHDELREKKKDLPLMAGVCSSSSSSSSSSSKKRSLSHSSSSLASSSSTSRGRKKFSAGCSMANNSSSSVDCGGGGNDQIIMQSAMESGVSHDVINVNHPITMRQNNAHVGRIRAAAAITARSANYDGESSQTTATAATNFNNDYHNSSTNNYTTHTNYSGSLEEHCRCQSSSSSSSSAEVTPENYIEKQQQTMIVNNNNDNNNNEGEGCHSSETATPTKVSADDDGQTSSVGSSTLHQVDWQEHEDMDDGSKVVQDMDDAREEHVANHENNHMYLPFRHDGTTTTTTTTTAANGRMDNHDNEQHLQIIVNDSREGGGCEENLDMNAAHVDVVENNTLHHDLVHNELPSEGNCNETAPDALKCPNSTPRRRHTLTVGQLKTAIFLEASIVHHHHHHHHQGGNDVKCIFDKYWNTIGKYLCFSRKCHLRIRSDQTTSSSSSSSSLVGFEAMLHNFLKTRRMKRLHNKLVLAIMASIMNTAVPQQRKTQILDSSIDQSNDFLSDVVTVDSRDEESDLKQWISEFGLQSGTWTTVGDEHLFTDTKITNNIDTNLIRSIRGDAPVEDDYDCIPSARLPGALHIEPSIRILLSHVGITASENAIWMVIVAVREYISGLIRRVISNDIDFDDGCAPSVPNHYQISIACPRIVSEQSENVTNRVDDSKFDEGRKIINSICLSHVLAENTSTASRLTSMYCVSVDGWRGCVSHPSLDKVDLLINSSIERAASRKEMFAEKSKQLTVMPNVGPRPQSDKSSVAKKESPPPLATSILKPTSAYPSDRNSSSSEQPTDISSKIQPFPSTSILKSVSDSNAQHLDGKLSQAHLQSSFTLPINTSQFAAQRMDQLQLLQSKFLHSQLTTPFIPGPTPQSVYRMQTMNNYNTTQNNMQPSCAMNFTPNPAQQFAMKPVVPEKSTQKKSILPSIVFTNLRHEQPQLLSRINEIFNPSNRSLIGGGGGGGGGGTKLTAMLAKPSNKASIATSGEINRTDEASMSKISDLGQSAHSESEKDSTSVNDDAKSTATIKSTTTVASRGRGFGAKNLAAMKARMSIASSSAKTPLSDSERK